MVRSNICVGTGAKCGSWSWNFTKYFALFMFRNGRELYMRKFYDFVPGKSLKR